MRDENRWIVFLLALLAAPACASTAAAPADEQAPEARPGQLESRVLPVDLYGQEATLWCWAATTKMVLKHLGVPGHEAAQCSLAQAMVREKLLKDDPKGAADCCDAESREAHRKRCVRVDWPDFTYPNVAGEIVEEVDYLTTECACALGNLPNVVELETGEEPKALRKALQDLLGSASFRELAGRTRGVKDCLRLLTQGDPPVITDGQLEAWLEEDYDDALKYFEDCHLGWEELTAEIDADRPVAFSWRFANFQVADPSAEVARGLYCSKQAHIMVATGYLSTPAIGLDGSSRWVWVNDPWPPGNGDRVLIPFEQYEQGPCMHLRDFYRIQEKGGTGGPAAGTDGIRHSSVVGRGSVIARLAAGDQGDPPSGEVPAPDGAPLSHDPEALCAAAVEQIHPGLQTNTRGMCEAGAYRALALIDSLRVEPGVGEALDRLGLMGAEHPRFGAPIHVTTYTLEDLRKIDPDRTLSAEDCARADRDRSTPGPALGLPHGSWTGEILVPIEIDGTVRSLVQLQYRYLKNLRPQFPALTRRQLDVWRLKSEFSDKEIATKLGISIDMVRTHLARIMQAHDAHSQLDQNSELDPHFVVVGLGRSNLAKGLARSLARLEEAFEWGQEFDGLTRAIHIPEFYQFFLFDPRTLEAAEPKLEDWITPEGRPVRKALLSAAADARLLPLYDDPELRLLAGEFVPASEVLKRLVCQFREWGVELTAKEES